jgi:type IV secretory pathway TrbF-like protein
MTNARLVILFLGVIALVSLAGIIWLVSQERTIPDVLIVTVSGSIASLGSILAKTTPDTPPPNV